MQEFGISCPMMYWYTYIDSDLDILKNHLSSKYSFNNLLDNDYLPKNKSFDSLMQTDKNKSGYFNGKEKLDLFNSAKKNKNASIRPISAFIHQNINTLNVFYST